MATFEAQVEGLTSLSIDGSSAPTQTELTQFLTDGAKEILSVIPKQKKAMYSTSNTLDSGDTTLTIGGSEILGVVRNDGTIDQPCRRIPLSLSGRAQDSEEMVYGTVTDPVWWITINALNMFPAPTDAQNGLIQTLAYPAVAYGDSAITKFPDEAEYLVPIYASVKAIQNALGAKAGDSGISTALGAITTELNKADDIISTAQGKVDAFYTSIGDIDDTTELWDGTNKRFKVIKDALDHAQDLIDNDKPHADYDAYQNLLDVNAALDGMQAHLADGETVLGANPASGLIFDALGLIKTAVDQAATAADKFIAANSDSVFGDEETFLTANSQLTRVKNALDQVSDIINGNLPSSTTDAFGAQSSEDIELAKSALSIASVEINRAQAHLTEWVAIGDMRVKEIDAALKEAQAYASEVQARLSYADAYQRASAARGAEGGARINQLSATVSVASQELARANIAIAEINTIITSYRLELEGVGPYLQAASGYISQAQGYSTEIQARLSVLTTEYTWLEKQQAKLQVDYDKGLQMVAGA